MEQLDGVATLREFGEWAFYFPKAPYRSVFLPDRLNTGVSWSEIRALSSSCVKPSAVATCEGVVTGPKIEGLVDDAFFEAAARELVCNRTVVLWDGGDLALVSYDYYWRFQTIFYRPELSPRVEEIFGPVATLVDDFRSAAEGGEFGFDASDRALVLEGILPAWAESYQALRGSEPLT